MARFVSKNETLNYALPVMLPNFIDRLGTSGISMLSAYLVQLQLPAATSSMVLAGARSAAFIGPLCIGVVVDKVGNFRMALVAFLFTGISFLLLPSAQSWVGVMLCAFVAQFGMAMNKVCMRGLIFDRVPKPLQKEALGWQRSGTNFGALVAYGTASLLALWWFPSIFYVDGLTSLGAGAVLFFLMTRNQKLDAAHRRLMPHAGEARGVGVKSIVPLLLLFSVSVFAWQVLYDLYSIGTPALLEKTMPGTGGSLFARLMLINTFLSGILAVKASQFFKDLRLALSVGVLFTALGSSLAHISLTLPMLVVGTIIWSIGEVAFSAVCIFIMGRLTEQTSRPGFWFSIATAIMSSGRMVAGAMVFPFIVEANGASLLFLEVGLVSVTLMGSFLILSRKIHYLF